MKNGQFWHFPWGLDRGFSPSCQLVLSVCPIGCPSDTFLSKSTFSMGILRHFLTKITFLVKITVFDENHGFDGNCMVHGDWLGFWKLNFQKYVRKVSKLALFREITQKSVEISTFSRNILKLLLFSQNALKPRDWWTRTHATVPGPMPRCPRAQCTPPHEIRGPWRPRVVQWGQWWSSEASSGPVVVQ